MLDRQYLTPYRSDLTLYSKTCPMDDSTKNDATWSWIKSFPGMTQVQIQSIFTICGFHIRKFTYSLNFICDTQINSHRTSVVTHGCVRVTKY